WNAVTAEGLRALIDSPLWGRLEELNLGSLDLEQASYHLVADALPRSRITRLGLRHSVHAPTFPVDRIEGLVAAPSWGKLEALDLAEHDLTGPAFRILMECPHLAGLKWLDLDSHDLTRQDGERLAACPLPAGLTVLSLANAAFPDGGLEALARSPHFRRLVYLNLGNSAVGDAGVVAFARSTAADRLRVWAIPAVSDEALRALADSPHPGQLTTLTFVRSPGGHSQTAPTDAGAVALARSPNLPNLAHIGGDEDAEGWLHLSEAGARALLECEHLAWFGWPTSVGRSPELPQAFRDRFRYFNGTEMLPGDVLLMFPWAKHAWT